MGLGIAYVASTRARLPVLVYDKSRDQIDKSLALMDKLLARDVQKGKIADQDAKDARSRITIVDELKGFRDVDMVIEVRPPHLPTRNDGLEPNIYRQSLRTLVSRRCSSRPLQRQYGLTPSSLPTHHLLASPR